MIYLIHNNKHVVQVLDIHFNTIHVDFTSSQLTTQLFEIAALYPKQLVAWCYVELKPFLNPEGFKKVFHHEKIMASFNPTSQNYLSNALGYADRNYFYNVNKTVNYPTWLMSSLVGGIHASVLNSVKANIDISSSFNYFLLSLAKHGMPQGLFCYSSPELLKENVSINYKPEVASTSTLYQFVKQHYKWVWVYFLTLSLCVYEKRLPIVALLKSLFYKQQHHDFNLGKVKINSLKQVNTTSTVDVIIPTIGRKKYLYDVLVDLSKQTLLPKTVVIVEQNPEPNSTSELDYLTTQDWPFIIDHTFTHQTGVCNARNIALSKTQSEWVLLGDDDNRFDANLIESLLDSAINYGIKAATTVYLQPHEKQTFMDTAQTSIFGAGNTLIHSSLLKTVKFDMSYEFNYGEDTDFGMQIRYQGEDVVFFSDIIITHLKAPFGGYRTKVKQLWDHEEIQPKPSPPIYLLYKTYLTKKQLLGYKLLLGLKTYKKSKIKNPVSFIKDFQTKWKISEKWSQALAKQND